MYAWVQDVPIGRSVYGDIMEGLGSETPDGLLLHLAYETEAGGLRYVDIWRDREACDRFSEDQLHPIVHPLLESANVHLDGSHVGRQPDSASLGRRCQQHPERGVTPTANVHDN